MSQKQSLVQKCGELFLGRWLDKPTPESLEFIAVEGERLSVVDYNRTNFVYDLLTRKGKRYEKIPEGYGWPTLPVDRGFDRTRRGYIREFLRPDETRDLNLRRENAPVSEELRKALDDSRIIIRPYCCSYVSCDLKVARRLLYVPGERAEEADEVLNQYRSRVTGILQPLRIHCPLKIRPVLKGQIKL